MKMLDLFSGIGGFSLAAEQNGIETIAFCEIEPFQRAVLRKHWPEVPIHEDITALTSRDLPGGIDIVCGGFPCQDISVAGKGAGIEHGKRSGLWREMFRLIDEIRPNWVVAENVPALRTRGADRVLADLEGAGYSVRPLVVGAWSVGAPHKRDRVWIVAHCQSQRCEEAGEHSERPPEWTSGRGEVRSADTESQRNRPCPIDRAGLEERHIPAEPDGPGHRSGRGYAKWPARPGEPQHPWEAPRLLEFGVGGAVDGIPERLVRFANRNAIKSYGNSIVPQVADVIFRAIMEWEVLR